MKLINLTVENFRVFRGRHSFDLDSPGAESMRNVVLFRGTNGAGKLTIFTALKLALFGLAVLGERVAQSGYSDYLWHTLHRYSENGKTILCPHGKVAITFEFVKSGCPMQITVQRTWTRAGRTVTERLELSQDGVAVRVPAEGEQAWLADLMPPTQALLSFFDAENLDELASPDQTNKALADAIRRLFGIDLIERLCLDLEQYTFKRGGSARTSHLQSAVPKLQAALDDIDAKIKECQEAFQVAAESEREIQDKISAAERQLAAEGGHYATQRPQLQRRLATVEQERAAAEGLLRDECTHLLPFALCPELCAVLSKTLASETELQRRLAAKDLWNERVETVKSALTSESVWQGLNLGPEERVKVAARLTDILALGDADEHGGHHQIVHMLSEGEREALQKLIRESEGTVPKVVVSTGAKLKALTSEYKTLMDDLQRAPDDEVLAPIHAEIGRLTEIRQVLKGEQASLSERLGSLQFQRTDKERDRNRAAEELATAQAGFERMRLAEGSKTVLKSYKDALSRQKLQQLEGGVVRRFNELCQKDSLLQALTISPEDFGIELKNQDGHIVRLSSLSAGERQVFVLALLWSARETCNQMLPLAIDTPVARLDTNHRSSFLNTFLPNISRQVLLFATTAEMETVVQNQIASSISRVYELRFVPEGGHSEFQVIEAPGKVGELTAVA